MKQTSNRFAPYRVIFSHMRLSFRFIETHPLTSDRRISAYYRYVLFHLWQLLRHNRPAAVKWVNGVRFYAQQGEAGIITNLYAGLQDFEEMSFLLHFLRAGDTFMDIGANVGAYTLLASGVRGAAALAFEPVPDTFKKLVQNIRLNALDAQVQCLELGVGAGESQVNFTDTTDSGTNHVAVGSESDVIRVKMLPLDAFYASGNTVSLIKIDVEGYEMEVLKGAPLHLQDPTLKAVIIELNGNGQRYGYTDNQVVSVLLDNGFLPYSYEPFSRSLVRVEHTTPGQVNVLFVRDPEYVSQRLQSAPKFRVLSRSI